MRMLKYVGAAGSLRRPGAAAAGARCHVRAARLAAAARWRRWSAAGSRRRRVASRATRAACPRSRPPIARDLAFGTGFVHAQDRFFQMDLSRRLRGRGAVRALRQGRAGAGPQGAPLQVSQRGAGGARAGPTRTARLLEAYARGVNAGWRACAAGRGNTGCSGEARAVAARGLRCSWSYAMWWDLQYSGIRREILRREVNARARRRRVRGRLEVRAEFLYPRGTSWDAPDGRGRGPMPPRADTPCRTPDESWTCAARGRGTPASQHCVSARRCVGSNSWAVAGRLTSDRRGARRQRHAPRSARADRLVSRAPEGQRRLRARWI